MDFTRYAIIHGKAMSEVMMTNQIYNKLVEEACQHQLNQKKLLKWKQAKLKNIPKFKKISVYGL